MFQWLKNIFSKKAPKSIWDNPELYEPSERAIFKFHDGQKLVSADPMVLYRKHRELGAELWADIRGANSPLKQADECYARATKSVRGIFGIKPFEEGGLTEAESWELFNQFQDYLDIVKKNSSQPSMLPMETSQPMPALSEPVPVTSNSLDTGSIEKELPIGIPPSLPKERQ